MRMTVRAAASPPAMTRMRNARRNPHVFRDFMDSECRANRRTSVARRRAYLQCPCDVRGETNAGGMRMDAPNNGFMFVGSLEELRAKGRLVVQGGHGPILVI